MAKRHGEEKLQAVASKRPRIESSQSYKFDILALSDELILKTLSFFTTADLATCECLSRNFQLLATDSQLWKERYYLRWIVPRALRIPGLKKAEDRADALSYSSKHAIWLEDTSLLDGDPPTDWKARYRLKENWNRGRFRPQQFTIGSYRDGPTVSQLCRGLSITKDSFYSLRVWNLRKTPITQVASLRFEQAPSQSREKRFAMSHTGIGVGPNGATSVVLGGLDGKFRVYELTNGHLKLRYELKAENVQNLPGTGDGSVWNISIQGSYVLIREGFHVIRLYHLPESPEGTTEVSKPELLMSQQRAGIQHSHCLSLRLTPLGPVVSYVHTARNVWPGWSIVLQEIRMSETGEQTDSRSVTAIEPPDSESTLTQSGGVNFRSWSAQANLLDEAQQPVQPANETAYAHPYLVITLDNAMLMAYRVTSTPTTLEIGPGRRLIGHAGSSIVYMLRVDKRGRAVSIDQTGADLRIWDLEAVLSSSPSVEPACVRISLGPEPVFMLGSGGGAAQKGTDLSCEQLAFDDERIVMINCAVVPEISDEDESGLVALDEMDSSDGFLERYYWRCCDFT